MRITLEIARMEVVRAVKDKSSFFWMLAFPVLYATFFGLIQFSGQSGASVGLCVADGDSSFFSQGMKTALSSFSEEMIDSMAIADYDRRDKLYLIEIEPSHVDSADCVRLLIIPSGFADSLINHRPAVLRLVTDKEGSFMATFTAQVMVWRAILENMASLVAAAMDSEGEGVESRFMEHMNRERQISVQSSFSGDVIGTPEGLPQTVPGTIVMMTLMILLTHGTATFAVERKRGLLLHLSATPASRSDIIRGKLLGRVLIGGVQVLLLWTLAVTAHHVFGIWIGYRLVETLPLLGVFAFTAASIGLFVAAVSRSEDTGVGVGIVLTLTMAALGGCWWPLEVVPKSMQVAGHFFPTAWAMDGLHSLMSYNRGILSTLPNMAILAVYGGVFAFFASKLIRVD